MEDSPVVPAIATSKAKDVIVLCLHGYGQTNDDLLRPLARLLKTRVGQQSLRLVLPTAPVSVFLPSQEGQPPHQGRAWWSRPTLSLNDTFSYAEFDESCAAVKSALAGSHADIILGFSQGAVMAALLLQTGALPHCRGAVLFGASGVQDPTLALLPPVRDVPALFVRGEKDALCSPEDTQRLAGSFANVQHKTHRWGHVVPSDAASRDSVLAFVGQCLADAAQQ